MTDRFVETARQMAAVQGLADYPFAVIPHPIAGNTDEELRAKAEAVLPAIVTLLTKRSAAAGESAGRGGTSRA